MTTQFIICLSLIVFGITLLFIYLILRVGGEVSKLERDYFGEDTGYRDEEESNTKS